ncbi:uncharacterized protein [Equus asinus]|uniref:uncharacterized protein n=1 Tax=Equus asinus TaxID=9793 RepID=UPI0038F72167
MDCICTTVPSGETRSRTPPRAGVPHRPGDSARTRRRAPSTSPPNPRARRPRGRSPWRTTRRRPGACSAALPRVLTWPPGVAAREEAEAAADHEGERQAKRTTRCKSQSSSPRPLLRLPAQLGGPAHGPARARLLRAASPLACRAVTQALATAKGTGLWPPTRRGRRDDDPRRWGGAGGLCLLLGCVGVRASPGPGRPPLLPPAGALGPSRVCGPGAGRRGRHEGSGLRHVLRVPHARSVAPALHVRPTTLVTTFAARPAHASLSPVPRPSAWCRRPRRPRDVGGCARRPQSQAPGPRAGGHVRPPAPARCAPRRAPPPPGRPPR